MAVQNILGCGCALGEGPLWFEGRLYWFDILSHTLHSCDERGQAHRTIPFSEPFSAAAAAGPNTLLLASASGLWRFDTGNSALELLCGLEADNLITRSNDGRADRQGGFWIGTMGRRLEPKAGALYRYYRGELRQLLSPLSIPNSICFSPDGAIAYFADSPTRKIMRWGLNADGWPVGDPEVFVDLSASKGSPDGSVIDREGALWNAQWGSSRIVRYRADGQEDRIIPLPVSQPTCPAFGGEDLSLLFVTTARDGVDAKKLGTEPQAGDLFCLTLPGLGLAEGQVIL
jgi:sugar lactone lactonase YvrE